MCVMFWFDESCGFNGFHSTSRNIFVHLSTCKRVCEHDTSINYDEYTFDVARRLGAIWASFSKTEQVGKKPKVIPTIGGPIRGPAYEVVDVGTEHAKMPANYVENVTKPSSIATARKYTETTTNKAMIYTRRAMVDEKIGSLDSGMTSKAWLDVRIGATMAGKEKGYWVKLVRVGIA